MSKNVNQQSIDYNLKAKIKLFAKNNNYLLKPNFLTPLEKLYNEFPIGVEFVTTNQKLNELFDCKSTKTKKITKAACLGGFLTKEVKSYDTDSRTFTYLHCTLAKLPELEEAALEPITDTEKLDAPIVLAITDALDLNRIAYDEFNIIRFLILELMNLPVESVTKVDQILESVGEICNVSRKKLSITKTITQEATL